MEPDLVIHKEIPEFPIINDTIGKGYFLFKLNSKLYMFRIISYYYHNKLTNKLILGNLDSFIKNKEEYAKYYTELENEFEQINNNTTNLKDLQRKNTTAYYLDKHIITENIITENEVSKIYGSPEFLIITFPYKTSYNTPTDILYKENMVTLLNFFKKKPVTAMDVFTKDYRCVKFDFIEQITNEFEQQNNKLKTNREGGAKRLNSKKLNNLTLVELKAYAKNKGIKGYSKLNKSELVSLLKSKK